MDGELFSNFFISETSRDIEKSKPTFIISVLKVEYYVVIVSSVSNFFTNKTSLANKWMSFSSSNLALEGQAIYLFVCQYHLEHWLWFFQAVLCWPREGCQHDQHWLWIHCQFHQVSHLLFQQGLQFRSLLNLSVYLEKKIEFNQGYRNRYNLIDRPSYSFWEIKKGFLFQKHLKDCLSIH